MGVRICKGIMSLMVALALVFVSSTNAFAAGNKKFIEQVRKEFTNYNEKTTKKYDTYREGQLKAFEDYNQKENDSLNRVNLFKVSNRYYNINNWKDFNKTVHLVLEKSESAKDTLNITKAYTYLGDYYESQAILDSSFQFYYKAGKMYEKLGDNFNWGKTIINKDTNASS